MIGRVGGESSGWRLSPKPCCCEYDAIDFATDMIGRTEERFIRAFGRLALRRRRALLRGRLRACLAPRLHPSRGLRHGVTTRTHKLSWALAPGLIRRAGPTRFLWERIVNLTICRTRSTAPASATPSGGGPTRRAGTASESAGGARRPSRPPSSGRARCAAGATRTRCRGCPRASGGARRRRGTPRARGACRGRRTPSTARSCWRSGRPATRTWTSRCCRRGCWGSGTSCSRGWTARSSGPGWWRCRSCATRATWSS